jgi:hypothetical protein
MSITIMSITNHGRVTMTNPSHAASYARKSHRDAQLKVSHPVEHQRAVEELTEAPRATCKHSDKPEVNFGLCEYCYDNYREAKREK